MLETPYENEKPRFMSAARRANDPESRSARQAAAPRRNKLPSRPTKESPLGPDLLTQVALRALDDYRGPVGLIPLPKGRYPCCHGGPPKRVSNVSTGFRRAVKVHRCTDARNSRKKSHLVPPVGPSDAASMRNVAIHMSVHHQEIGGSTYLEAPSRIAVARVSRKVSRRFRLMFTMSGSG
jgi:hypothetical protein